MKNKLISIITGITLIGSTMLFPIQASAGTNKWEGIINNLTKAEREMLEKGDCFAALNVYMCSSKATELGSQNYSDPCEGEYADNNANAFRHAYWNALGVGYVGPNAMDAFSSAHELTEDEINLKSFKNDNEKNHFIKAREMDIKNNKLGIDTGKFVLNLMIMSDDSRENYFVRDSNNQIEHISILYYDVNTRKRCINHIPILTDNGLETFKELVECSINRSVCNGKLNRLDSNYNIIKTDYSTVTSKCRIF